MNKLRFYFFHLMPYPYIPPAAEFDSTWVSLSNKYYDPQRGRRAYIRQTKAHPQDRRWRSPEKHQSAATA